MMPAPRSPILILTAGYGEGHNTAARSLRSAFLEHPGVEAVVLDVFKEFAPIPDTLSRKAYLQWINRAPRTWGAFYRWFDRSRLAPALFRLLAGHARLLEKHLAQFRPAALCCTYPVYPWLLEGMRRRGVALPPVYTVVTDAISINSLWYRAPSDRWFVTDEDSAAVLRDAGLTPDAIEVSGFPVGLSFADRSDHLRLPADPAAPRRVLFMVNSGNRAAPATVRALLAKTDCSLTVTVGRNKRLQQSLGELAGQHGGRLTVLGWTDRIPELLMTHHLLIGKAGGATTQEAINALCPMIVNQVVPGQEEGNWELLRRHGAGARAESPEKICALVRRAFADDGSLWCSWRRQLAGLARPQAARTVVRAVLAENSPGGAGFADRGHGRGPVVTRSSPAIHVAAT